ncbi:unnamed protein product [Rotaria sp. Silwood1]|nr:unnamed protein product [Rotaria sp. Silwood1]CAF1132404.1 unnamed protein product [Rotaria sp. Silwood1]
MKTFCYTRNQITGKLEAVGDTIELFHFILHPKDEQNLIREEQDKGKELYSVLVQFEIIQRDTIRKIFRNNSQERDKIEKIIRNDLDPSIADPLISLLNKLKDNISQQNQYFYQTDLPFTIKEEEGNNIRIYLKEKNILKSGGLAKYKYVDIKRNIERILKNIQFENDKELIWSKILSLQGDIRSFKKDLKANLKDFINLQDQENVPKDKSWWDWNAFAVAMIGLVQVIAGAVLVAFGLTQIGNALISGIFSWKEWAIQKAISFGLSMLTAGIGKFLTDKIMEQIQENVIQKIKPLYLQKKTLGKDILLPQQFDNIRTRVVSSLRNSYHLFADGLKKSNSKYVKIAATTLKAIDIINKLWTVVQSVLQFEHVFIIL